MSKTMFGFLLISLGLHAQTYKIGGPTGQLGGGGGGGDPLQLIKKEREALKKVVLHSFTVNPLTVKPFGTVTASWNVTLPTDTPFAMFVELNGKAVPAIGSQSFVVNQQTVFALVAAISDDPTVARQLRQWTVHLDSSECHAESFPASVIATPLKDQFDKIFSGSDKFTLKDGGTIVTPGSDQINIDVPLTISVPDWFDADMEVTIQLTIAGASKVFVGDPIVHADVHWSALSNWLSLGCTDAVGDGMSQMAQVFLEQIVSAQLIPLISQGLNDQVNSFTASLKASDPSQRTYVLTSLTYSGTTGLTISACPQ